MRFVEKKVESSKIVNETGTENTKKDEADATGDKMDETPKASAKLSKPEETEKGGNNATANKENADAAIFGLITDEDKQADQEALDKINAMIDERMKNKPLPPPPSLAVHDGSANSKPEVPSRSKDGELDMDATKGCSFIVLIQQSEFCNILCLTCFVASFRCCRRQNW